MSLGFNLINIQFLVREIVDGDAKAIPSATSIALSGKVESIDKLLTFIGIGFLSALSDKYGRKPLISWLHGNKYYSSKDEECSHALFG